MLELIELSISAIKSLLCNNINIRKLLYNDSNNALNIEAPSEEEIKNYILTKPFYNLLDDQYNKNSVISIQLSRATPEEEKVIKSIIKISIITNVDKWELVNNKIRPIQLANEIIKELNNKKLNTSNAISFDDMQEIVYNKNLIGYELSFDLADGKNKIDNY